MAGLWSVALPVEVRDPLERALAMLEEAGDERVIRAELNAAIEAAGFARYRAELIPLPEELTEVQRACAEVIAGRDGFPRFNGWALPDTPRKLSRYLHPPEDGVLERVVTHEWQEQSYTEPLWRALLRHDAKLRAAGKYFRSLGLPISERLEAFGDIFIGAYNINRFGLTWGDPREIDGSHGRWALDMARRLMEGRHGTTDQAIKLPVFLALVRAGRGLDGRLSRDSQPARARNRPSLRCLPRAAGQRLRVRLRNHRGGRLHHPGWDRERRRCAEGRDTGCAGMVVLADES